MLTFLSRLLKWSRGPRLRVVPDCGRDFNGLPSAPRVRLSLAADRDTAVVRAPAHVGATAFVAGQGARIYSLDAFRTPDPHHPRAA